MKDRILRLSKRLNKFTLDEISLIAEDVEECVLKLLLETLVQEKKLIKRGDLYLYNKKVSMNKNINEKPLFFQFHDKQTIDYIIRGFCADIEALKMMDVFGVSKHVINKFYQYLRITIYEKQFCEFKKEFEKMPKIPQERIYMNTKAYLYLYNHKLYVSEKYIANNNSRKHRDEERLEIKNIYLRSYRKVLSRSFEHKFHIHLAEEIWKYGKAFKEKYTKLKLMLY